MGEQFTFDAKIHCGYCGGEAVVPVPATDTEPPTVEKCAACNGTGLNDQARIVELERGVASLNTTVVALDARMAKLERRLARVYQDVPALWAD